MASKSDSPERRRTVHPVTDGSYLMGVPHHPIIADAETAARLVKTGAFTYEGTLGDTEPMELSADHLSALDRLFDPVEQTAPPEVAPPQEPAPAGPES